MNTNYFSKIKILDGGMGQQLLSKGLKSKGSLWSATALVEKKYHQLVVDAHLDFINSGSDVIVTNNFSARRVRMIQNDVEEHFNYANKKAGELAIIARNKSNKNILIAGSIPTRGITYQPHIHYDENEIYDEFFQTAKELNPFVDFFYLDAICSIKETITALNSIKDFKKPVLIGLHFRKNLLLPSGESVQEISSAIKNYDCAGLMSSCVSPEIYIGVSSNLKKQNLPFGFAINAFIDIPDKFELDEKFSAQPNSYLGLRKDITPIKFSDFAINSFNNGAKFLKGCCNIMPKHISALSKLI